VSNKKDKEIFQSLHLSFDVYLAEDGVERIGAEEPGIMLVTLAANHQRLLLPVFTG
jgi:hypothetical protein